MISNYNPLCYSMDEMRYQYMELSRYMYIVFFTGYVV